jgi:hypothetical protein
MYVNARGAWGTMPVWKEESEMVVLVAVDASCRERHGIGGRGCIDGIKSGPKDR